MRVSKAHVKNLLALFLWLMMTGFAVSSSDPPAYEPNSIEHNC
jgi:hypothetical protein